MNVTRTQIVRCCSTEICLRKMTHGFDVCVGKNLGKTRINKIALDQHLGCGNVNVVHYTGLCSYDTNYCFFTVILKQPFTGSSTFHFLSL